jgi:hypothetical protein
MSTAESERLLIADDDPNLLAAYVLFFQAYGCEIRADDLGAWTRARRLATLFGPRGCRAAQSWDQLAIPARYRALPVRAHEPRNAHAPLRDGLRDAKRGPPSSLASLVPAARNNGSIIPFHG